MDQPTKRSWWQRHWKWFVPLCIGTPIVICGGGITLIFVLVFGAMKSSDAYTQSLAAVQSNPAIQSALGSPIEPGFLVSGNIDVSGGSGEAQLSYSVTGPNGSGTVYVSADKSAGVWFLSVIDVTIDASGETIDALPDQ